MVNRAFSKILILAILIVLVASGFFVWQYFGVVEEETAPAEEVMPSITVLSPNGGERWKIGRYHEIRWKAMGLPKDRLVMISLYDVSKPAPYDHVHLITALDVPSEHIRVDKERFFWRIDDIPEGSYSYIPEGNKYKITMEVIALARGGEIIFEPGVVDRSDNYFSIVRPEEIEASINITFPKEREQLIKEQTYEIRWETKGIDKNANVRIELYNTWDRAYHHVITDKHPNTGIFRWTTDPHILPSLIVNDYKITITTVDQRVSARSGWFDIHHY